MILRKFLCSMSKRKQEKCALTLVVGMHESDLEQPRATFVVGAGHIAEGQEGFSFEVVFCHHVVVHDAEAQTRTLALNLVRTHAAESTKQASYCYFEGQIVSYLFPLKL